MKQTTAGFLRVIIGIFCPFFLHAELVYDPKMIPDFSQYPLFTNAIQHNVAEDKEKIETDLRSILSEELKTGIPASTAPMPATAATAPSPTLPSAVPSITPAPTSTAQLKSTEVPQPTKPGLICIDPQDFLNKIFDDPLLNAKTISIKSQPAKLQDILDLVGTSAGLDFAIDADIKGDFGKISFKEVKPGAVLSFICAHSRPPLAIIKEGTIWQIMLRSKAEEYLKSLQQPIVKPAPVAPTPTPQVPVIPTPSIASSSATLTPSALPAGAKPALQAAAAVPTVAQNVKKQKQEQRIIDIQHAVITDDFKRHLEKTWAAIIGEKCARESMLTIDTERKKVVVRGKPKHIEEFVNFLVVLDEVPVRVRIDVLIVLADKTFGLDFGINWSGIYNKQSSVIASKKNFAFTGLGGRLNDFPTPTKSTDPNNANLLVNPNQFAINLFTKFFDAASTFITLPFVFGGPDLNTRRLNLVLNAAERQEKAKIIARPSLLVNNNQVAKMLIGQSLPLYTTVQDIVQAAVRTLSALNYKDVGISFQVQPTVSKDHKNVSLDIYIEVSEVISGSTETNAAGVAPDPPVLLLFKVKNNVLLQNGQTTIIGGLVSNRERHREHKVPYVSDLPVIGRLFKSTDISKAEVEDYIFITPTIVE